jgi:hypothetical protein
MDSLSNKQTHHRSPNEIVVESWKNNPSSAGKDLGMVLESSIAQTPIISQLSIRGTLDKILLMHR